MNHPDHICDLILNAAQSSRKDEPAFVYTESSLTWAQMEFDIRAVAGALNAAGIKPGDNVAVLLPNLPLHPILAFAAPLLGAVYLPIDPARPMPQLAQLLRNPVPAAIFILESQATALENELKQNDLHIPVFPVGENGFILGDQWPREAKPWDKEPVGESDAIAVRRHTSGVSQECQLVPLSHRNLVCATEAARRALQVLPSSVLYGTHAYYDTFGYLFQMLLPAWANCTLHTCRHWSAPIVARQLRDTGITAYIGAAAHFEQLLPELQALEKEEIKADAVRSVEIVAEVPASTIEQNVDEAYDSDTNAQSTDGASSIPDNAESSDKSDEDKIQVDRLVAESSSATDPVHSHSPLRKLRFALCAGAYGNFNVLSEFANSLGCPVVTAYGTAETAGVIALNPAHFDPGHPESVGRVISGLEVSIRDEEGLPLLPDQIGEIWVKGLNLFQGYECQDNGGIEEEWYATSDLGYFDVNHWLYLVSRKEDRVVRGGFAVYPTEVENALASHKNIKECAVVGRPDISMGEEVVAFVVANSETTPEDKDLIEHCADKLPKYKIPTLYMTVDHLPRSENGFILRRELRDRLHSAV